MTKDLEETDTIHDDQDYYDAFHELQELNLVVQFLDASSDPDDFEKPIKYNINSDSIVKINMETKKEINFHMSTYEVITKSGFFYPFAKTETSIAAS